MVYMISKLGILAWATSGALAQFCPNTVAVNNPNSRTMCQNGTFFLVPVPIATVKSAVTYPLLPLPTSDKSLFPNGFPEGMFPVLVSNYYGSDIRLYGSLEIDSLLIGNVYVPYVDRLQDGSNTPFQYLLTNIVGGTNGQTTMGVVPALVSTLFEGSTTEEGQFLPNNAGYQALSPTEYSAEGKVVTVPNPVSGPGVVTSLYDMTFSATSSPYYTAHTFHAINNQPLILNNGPCQRNEIVFNQTFSNPFLCDGVVTLYSPPLPTGFQGTYQGEGVGGYSAAGENIGFNGQDCKQAAEQVDPNAVQ